MAHTGRIIEQHKSLYHVDTADTVVPAVLRGLLKRDRDKPCVGDIVTIEQHATADEPAIITMRHPRRNRLLRPCIANVDQALLLVSLCDPAIERDAIDRFLLHLDVLELPVAILFNKTDLLDNAQRRHLDSLIGIYEAAGYACVAFSAHARPLPDRLLRLCHAKVSTLAGASGVGKSTLLNVLVATEQQSTATVSRKTRRGVHTTTGTRLLRLDAQTFIADTPGFVALSLPQIDECDLHLHFPELAPFAGTCRFNNCRHLSEPGCAARARLDSGGIDPGRYTSYVRFHTELAARPRHER